MAKAKWKLPKWQSIVAWLVTLGTVIVAVTPILPPETPAWLRGTLAVAAVVIAKLAQSDRRLPPTVAEAHDTLDAAKSHRGRS